MSNTSLIDRMKLYESVSDSRIPAGIPYVIRLDGKGFSKHIKRWNCNKPFDVVFHNIMVKTAKKVLDEVSDGIMAWTGSDEISIVCLEKDVFNPWYSKRINKILSLSASIATATFNLEAKQVESENYFNVSESPAYFDSRIIQFPSLCECFNSIVYRQRDCKRNSISGWARHFYSTKQLQNKNSDEKIEMLKEKGFDFWEQAPRWSIYGEILFKANVIFNSEDPTIKYPIFDIAHVPTEFFPEQNGYAKVYIRKHIFGFQGEISANMLDELNSLNVSSDDLIYQDLEEEPNSQIWDKKDKFEKI